MLDNEMEYKKILDKEVNKYTDEYVHNVIFCLTRFKLKTKPKTKIIDIFKSWFSDDKTLEYKEILNQQLEKYTDKYIRDITLCVEFADCNFKHKRTHLFEYRQKLEDIFSSLFFTYPILRIHEEKIEYMFRTEYEDA